MEIRDRLPRGRVLPKTPKGIRTRRQFDDETKTATAEREKEKKNDEEGTRTRRFRAALGGNSLIND